MNNVKTRLRAPLDLPQLDRNQCLSCVAANILHMFGLGDGDVAIVDRRIGRGVGEYAHPARVSRLLLESGLGMHSIGTYDQRQFLSRGLDYLREFHAGEWTHAWDEHWTAQELAQHRQVCLDELALEAFSGLTTEHREPTLADIRAWLDRGRVVVLVLGKRGELDCHAVLVYAHNPGPRGGSFEVYCPDEWGDCLETFSARYLSRWWLRDEGLCAIGVDGYR